MRLTKREALNREQPNIPQGGSFSDVRNLKYSISSDKEHLHFFSVFNSQRYKNNTSLISINILPSSSYKIRLKLLS